MGRKRGWEIENERQLHVFIAFNYYFNVNMNFSLKKKFVNIKMTGVGTLISPLGGENCLWKSCGSQFKRIICGIVASNYCWSLAFGEYEQNSIQRLANAAFTAWGTNKALKKRALNVESEAHSLSPDSLDLHGRSLGLVTCLKIGTCHNFTGFSITEPNSDLNLSVFLFLLVRLDEGKKKKKVKIKGSRIKLIKSKLISN